MTSNQQTPKPCVFVTGTDFWSSATGCDFPHPRKQRIMCWQCGRERKCRSGGGGRTLVTPTMDIKQHLYCTVVRSALSTGLDIAPVYLQQSQHSLTKPALEPCTLFPSSHLLGRTGANASVLKLQIDGIKMSIAVQQGSHFKHCGAS